MNCAGTVQSNLIVAIYFSQKGDGVLNTVCNLMTFLGYGNHRHLRSCLDVVILLDRGYHLPSVIQFFLSLRCSLLGTEIQKAGNWCFCTGGDPRGHQKVIPIEGARAVFFAFRKVNNISSFAMCYRNGSKGIGNIHSTLAYSGVWDLVNKKKILRSLLLLLSSPHAKQRGCISDGWGELLSLLLARVACHGLKHAWVT